MLLEEHARGEGREGELERLLLQGVDAREGLSLWPTSSSRDELLTANAWQTLKIIALVRGRSLYSLSQPLYQNSTNINPRSAQPPGPRSR